MSTTKHLELLGTTFNSSTRKASRPLHACCLAPWRTALRLSLQGAKRITLLNTPLAGLTLVKLLTTQPFEKLNAA